jgi:hypothetical protein
MSTLPTLPSSLSVTVNGGPLELEGKPNKAGTGIWYEATGVVPQQFESAAEVEAALGKVVVSYDNAELKVGEVHVSQPRLYGKGHEKAGQTIPGTGGNLTVTHSASIQLADRDGGSHGYTLMVSVTYLDGKGVRITAKAIRQTTAKVIAGISF